MSVDLHSTEQNHVPHHPPAADAPESSNDATANADAEEDEEEDGEDEEDDEPKLKYTKLTGSLSNVYRNGDSTSASTVAGDKMVLGTHNGNIHVLSLPGLQGLRTYHAHSASITSVSISPTPPPPQIVWDHAGSAHAGVLSPPPSTKSQPTQPTSSPRTPKAPPSTVPNTPNNQIYIATSSLDGHVCISSLIDQRDVQLRNFARPVQAVALSPVYKSDRTYLSGGLAGKLILTVGGRAGASVDANTNSAAAAASGWLGSVGLASDRGKDTVLHSGEGAISCISWSGSGKWVVWVNEEGIKIMRSHLKLGSEQSEDAWRRIAHAARPNRRGWEEMAGVWKARAAWIDERKLESDAEPPEEATEHKMINGVNGVNEMSSPAKKSKVKVERLVVGWGDTAWILHVQEGGTGAGGKKQVGSADIVHKLQFRDCIVSGISLYTPSLLAILAYRTRDDDDKPLTQDDNDTPRKGRHHRQTSLAPQLRLVHVGTGEEVDLDELPMSRFETLSSQDYQLNTLFIPQPPAAPKTAAQQKGALEGLWDVAGGKYANRLFSSSASVLSRSSSGVDENGRASFASPTSSAKGIPPPSAAKKVADAHPYAAEPGLKLFIQSPYDCVLAVKRDLSDHRDWLLERERYAEAWQLIDSHPEVVETSTADKQSFSSESSAPAKGAGSLADFFADDASQRENAGPHAYNSAAQKEKRRIGDLWLQQLVAAKDWSQAGQVAGTVLGTSPRWDHWVWTFARAGRFDEITPYIPSTALKPPLPSVVYELVLGHYISTDRPRLPVLLEKWDPELFDIGSVIKAIESRLDSHEVGEDTVEDGVQGRDWRILLEALAKLYLADGRVREALRCYIRAQNAEKAMELIREEKLMEALGEDVPGLLMLRVSREQMRSAPHDELEEACHEVLQLLVDEALRGTLMPATVIRQLESKGPTFRLFIYFYLKALWNGTAKDSGRERAPRGKFGGQVIEGHAHALVEDHADLAVELFADYDRDLLMTFLRASTIYNYEQAAAICEQRHYVPELVHVLSKTGQTKRALSLIINELGDVSQAISFAKENPDLWDDLLDYSMDQPRFIRGLLEEVGTAIDPITLVRRIPEGLEIEGLREGIARMMREHDIQFSISEGVARVLRGEVGMGMDTLRAGQKKAVRFEVVHESLTEVDLAVRDPPTNVEGGEELPVAKRKVEKEEKKSVKPGHCVGCGDVFLEDEKELLIGFACGHVYHLSCLLKANPDTSDPDTISRLQSQLGYDGGGADEGFAGRSVGAKVAHAHIIRNVVHGGCQHCRAVEGA